MQSYSTISARILFRFTLLSAMWSSTMRYELKLDDFVKFKAAWSSWSGPFWLRPLSAVFRTGRNTSLNMQRNARWDVKWLYYIGMLYKFIHSIQAFILKYGRHKITHIGAEYLKWDIFNISAIKILCAIKCQRFQHLNSKCFIYFFQVQFI